MDKIDYLEQLCKQNEIHYVLNAPLREYCTFRVGGPVDMLVTPRTEHQIIQLLQSAQSHDIPVLVLGKGSNLLFSDDGFRGLAIHLGQPFSEIRQIDHTTLECHSGTGLSALCRYAQERALTGLEFAYGIPGSLGGAVYMNAGAYGGEIKDVLQGAYHLERNGTTGYLKLEQMEMRYRHSVYVGTDLILTRIVLRLKPADPEEVRVRMADYMDRRKSKQPLEYPSAGSTFKRPVGAYASALVDQCGLKGRRVGGAVVSTKHAGFIVNDKNATCADILSLIELVQQEVLRQTGYQLECEIKVIQ